MNEDKEGSKDKKKASSQQAEETLWEKSDPCKDGCQDCSKKDSRRKMRKWDEWNKTMNKRRPFGKRMEKVGKSRPQDDRPISRLLLEGRGPKTWVAGWQGGIAIRKVFVRNPCNYTGKFPDHLENFQKVQKVQKLPKVAQSGPKVVQSGPNWPKVVQTLRENLWMDQSAQNSGLPS